MQDAEVSRKASLFLLHKGKAQMNKKAVSGVWCPLVILEVVVDFFP